ncbi:methylaspartate mutase subunit E [Amycolatopsis magusensis]|uniref:methylaspartate mutase subunit E n=1 Tax=Amycolatopsis magusensis TaxID=882444 RepID=UPI003C2D556B
MVDLRTQNELRTFFSVADEVDVVMVSTLDGHGRFYTREFRELQKEYGTTEARWYIGGNLAVSTPADELVRHFRELGFHRVFPGYVDIAEVLRCLDADLVGTAPRTTSRPAARAAPDRRFLVPPDDQRIGERTLLRTRREVLTHWRTGAEAADLDENASFLSGRPHLAALQEARANGLPLLQPRCGVATAAGQARLFARLRAAGADVLSYQVDSLSRLNDYSGAAEGILASSPQRSVLNGFPMVNHGVRTLRRLAAATPVPLQARHSTRDPRLLAEISYAGGVSAFEGGAITYNIPYYKDYPLAESVPAWQYVDRLTGLYAERYGLVLDREFFGVLTATLLPPCLAIVTVLLEMLLAVAQGVRSVSLGYAEQGYRPQDVAAIQVLSELAHELLAGSGHHGVRVATVFHQYMGAFPAEPTKAGMIIRGSAGTARLAGASRMLLKTTAEAWGIPGTRENAESIVSAHRAIRAVTPLDLDHVATEFEKSVLRTECTQLLDGVLSCGDGVATSIVNAFDRGILDIPFAPNVDNRGEVLGLRDADGAVRLLVPGRLPLSTESKRFHRERVQDRIGRSRTSRHASAAELVATDIRQIALGDFDNWPLN